MQQLNIDAIKTCENILSEDTVFDVHPSSNHQEQRSF